MSRLSKLVLPEENNYSCRFFLKLYPEIKISARYETQTAKYREDRHRDNISQIPRKLFEGLSADRSTNALHFPDDRTYFSIETFPKSIPFVDPAEYSNRQRSNNVVKEIRRSTREPRGIPRPATRPKRATHLTLNQQTGFHALCTYLVKVTYIFLVTEYFPE